MKPIRLLLCVKEPPRKSRLNEEITPSYASLDGSGVAGGPDDAWAKSNCAAKPQRVDRATVDIARDGMDGPSTGSRGNR